MRPISYASGMGSPWNRTHCSRGHAWVPENRTPNDKCRPCKQLLDRLRYERRRPEHGRVKTVVDPDRFPCGHLRSSDNTRSGRHDCAECHRADRRARYYADPEAARAAVREWHRQNPGENSKRARESRYANPERARDRTRRDQQLRRAGAAREPDTLEYLAILANDPCAYCGAPADSVDHIRAVSRGGDNHWTNYTAACLRCNSQKRAQDLLTFLLRRAEGVFS